MGMVMDGVQVYLHLTMIGMGGRAKACHSTPPLQIQTALMRGRGESTAASSDRASKRGRSTLPLGPACQHISLSMGPTWHKRRRHSWRLGLFPPPSRLITRSRGPAGWGGGRRGYQSRARCGARGSAAGRGGSEGRRRWREGLDRGQAVRVFLPSLAVASTVGPARHGPSCSAHRISRGGPGPPWRGRVGTGGAHLGDARHAEAHRSLDHRRKRCVCRRGR